MDTLLHPAGPEPERTYWIRRGVVVAAALLALILLFWLVGKMFGGGSEQSGAPAPQESSTAAGTTASSSPASAPGASSPAASSPAASASTTSSHASSPSASASASGKPSATTTASEEKTPSTPTPVASTTSEKPSASPTGPVMCEPKDVVVNVSGAKTVKSGDKTTLSVTFTSPTACILDFTRVPFELSVTSGSDRIWSTDDCGPAKISGLLKMQPFKPWSHSWTWDTKRSAAECKSVDEYLRPGTYVATADLKGSQKRVQVMQLVG